MPILERLDGTYAETSPRGRGAKIICREIKPLGSGRKMSIDDGGIEIYDSGRFFTITGQVWDPSEPTQKQQAVNWITDTYFSTPSPAATASDPPAGGRVMEDDRAEGAHVSTYV